ncbi:MAG: 16S rRNA (guanine(527)-N(7))-methyltransferase RsmG [Nitrospirae bacterium]|nr:16S rRNA (guanine(527)-N(7))-methyltransferase RsmG [Nitrospirota bacterium]
MEHFEGWIELLNQGAAGFGLALREFTLSEFAVYLKELQSWNEKTNLTGTQDEKEIVVKHLIDSMAACRVLIPVQDPRLLDIGSGAGFPGLVLKLAIPALHVTLLEPSQKRVAFLRHLIGKLHLKDIDVVAERMDTFAMQEYAQGRFGWATVRALSVNSLLGPIRSVLSEKGKLILYRTRPIDRRSLSEIVSNKLEIYQQIAYSLPNNFGSRVLTVIQKSNDLDEAVDEANIITVT